MIFRTALKAFACGIGLLVFGVMNASAAPVVNGDFENGLQGWYTSTGGYPAAATVALATSGSPYEPLAGRSSAFMVAISNQGLNEYWTCSHDVWNNQCPLPIPFTTGNGDAPTFVKWPTGVVFSPWEYVDWYFNRGSYVAQDIEVRAGDVLTWDWKRYGELSLGDNRTFIDNGWFIATNGQDWVRTSIRAGAPNSYKFVQGGLWSIYFGVQQTEDDQIWSAMALDSVRLNEVPEPSSLLLCISATFALVATRRKSRPRSDT